MLLLLFVCLACSTPSNCVSCNASNTCQTCSGAYAYDPSTNMCARTFIHNKTMSNSFKENIITILEWDLSKFVHVIINEKLKVLDSMV